MGGESPCKERAGRSVFALDFYLSWMSPFSPFSFIERAGVEPVLPKVPAPTMQTIDVLRIPIVRASQGLGQSRLRCRRGDQVDVIGHQAIAVHSQPVPLPLFLKQTEVRDSVVVHEEHVLAVVAPLRDVVRQARNDDPGNSRH